MPSQSSKNESIHLELFPDFKDVWLEEKVFQEIEDLMQIRDIVLKELESTREQKIIGNSLEARVLLEIPDDKLELLKNYHDLLSELFIVSEVKIVPAAGKETRVSVEKVPWKKCQRCWNYSNYVGTNKDYPDFCFRCEEVVRSIES